MQTSRTFSIHFWLNLAKKKNNLAPIYARITIDGKRAEISLKREATVTYWDTQAKRVKQRIPEGLHLNPYLDKVYTDLLECHTQLSSEYKLVTAQGIKARYLGEDEQHKTLLELIQYHNSNMKRVLKPGTLKNYFTTEKYIRKFLLTKKRTSDIYLNQLSYSFIIDFENFLRSNSAQLQSRPLANNGVMKHLERLKKLINLAVNLEWIDKNPFKRFKLKFKKYQRDFLSKIELEKLELFSGLRKDHLRITRDIFIFSCYTGLSYSDVKSLSETNIVRGIDGKYWIFSHRQKNDQPIKIPLLDKALFILEQYRKFSNDNNITLFPVYSNQKINLYLKEIAEIVEINKKLTFHSARHTFATTVTLSNNVPIESVSKLLGHTKLSTTQVYARVMEHKISDDFNKLRTKLNETKKTSNPLLKFNR
ncbi:site-specific integrase [Rasiella sp. SM2506]|uniref:site-specific integrase n=1 Tax=Rasiella sp. SM2506 TaxID=3423914 RepID=UPI003D797FF8